jgi:hypothetical protein
MGDFDSIDLKLAIKRTGWIYCTDLNAQSGDPGVSKIYQDTGNTVLQSVTSPSGNIRLMLRSSFPLVRVNGTPGELTRDVDQSHYAGTVDVTIASSGDVLIECLTPDGDAGATDTVVVTLDLPPTLLSLSFTGGYPGGQTELKAGDTYQITGTTDFNADAVEVQDYEAGTLEVLPFAVGTNFTVTMTIANRGTSAVARPARVRARSASTAAYGATRDTDELGGTTDGVDLVNLNNLYPTATIGTITYPASQGALKGSETASIVMTTANLDTIAFDSPNGDVSVTNPSTDETPKTVTRIAGSYNVSINNFRVTATRDANDAVTINQAVVRIANVAAVITVSPATARVRSGAGAGNDTVISIISNQQLFTAPTLDPAASRGTFQGGGFAGGPTTWTRTLRVTDAENPGTGAANAWLNLVAVNLANTTTTTITTGPTYVVGGFNSRTLNFAAFTANSTETVPLTTEAKLSAGSFSNGNPSVRQPFGTADTTDVGKEGWYAPTAASGVVNLHMLHSPTVAANSGGITLVTVQEAV